MEGPAVLSGGTHTPSKARHLLNVYGTTKVKSCPDKQLLFSNYSLWKHRPPCHPDRSAAQWRDLRFAHP